MQRRIISSLSLLAAVAVAPAADLGDLRSYGDSALPFTQVRIGFGQAPTAARYDTTFVPDVGASVRYTDVVDTKAANTLSFGVYGGTLDPFGAVFGAELVYSWTNQSFLRRGVGGTIVTAPGTLQNTHYRLMGTNILAGAGWALSDRIHFELLALGGIGFAKSGHPDGSLTLVDDAAGWYYQGGIRAGGYATWKRLVIGGCVEYTSLHAKFRNNWSNGQSRSDAEVTGVGARFEIGYRIQ
ncbi:MAG: hypothetical protein AAB263_15705 [Planctomycetota bacterium]